MDDANWQTVFDSAERLHRSVLAEVNRKIVIVVLIIVFALGWR